MTDGDRTAVSDVLVAAYRRAQYRVTGTTRPFVLRIDDPSPALLGCHRAFRVATSAFITAWNPGSRPVDRPANLAAALRLEARLAAFGLVSLAGCGADPDGEWPEEPSVLVLGLDRARAVAVGRDFGQNAVVCAEEDGIPRLVLLR